MADLCILSGTFCDPAGSPFGAAKLVIRPVSTQPTVREDGSIVAAVAVASFETAEDGAVSIGLAPGLYRGSATQGAGGRSFAFDLAVPDLETAPLADYIGRIDVEVQTSAQLARDQAVEAAGLAGNAAQAALDDSGATALLSKVSVLENTVTVSGIMALEDQLTQLSGNDAAFALAIMNAAAVRRIKAATRALQAIATEPAWEPLNGLGAKLIAWWRVDDYATLMTDDGGGLIASWTDCKLGRSVTATGAARPIYQATGLYGRPCLVFDGIAALLETTNLAGFPTGAADGCLVAVCGPLVAPGATTHLAAYGSTSANAQRDLRILSGGDIAASTGTIANNGAPGSAVLNVVIGSWAGGFSNLFQNGVRSADTPKAATVATATTRLRFGASVASTPNQFGAMKLTDVMVISGTLTPYEKAKLEGYLAHKRGAPGVLPVTHPHVSVPPRATASLPSALQDRYVTTGSERMSGASTAVGAYTGFKGRIVQVFGSDDCSDVRIGFSNWFIDNQTSALAETDNSDPITLSKVAVVYDGISVPVTFGGSRSVVLAPGETLKLSDVISPQLFGFDRFKVGSLFEIRYMGTLASSASKMLYNARDPNAFSVTAKEQGFWYDPAFAVDDVDATGIMATPVGNQGSLIISPTAIIGKYDDPVPVIEVFGDSIPHGLRDFYSGGWSTNGVGGANGKVNGGGWARRTLTSLGLSYAMTSKVGHQYAHMAANFAKRAVFFKYSTHALFTLGINDLNFDISAASIMASATPIWAAYRAAGGQGVIHTTMLPRVKANTWFATNLMYQETDPPYAPGGERDKLNFALKNARASLLDEIIDIARPVSDRFDPSKWAVPNYRATLVAPSLATDKTLTLSAPPSVEMSLIVAPGDDLVDSADFNVLSVSGNVATFSAAPFMWAHDSGTEVRATLASDGTHPSAQAHKMMAQEAAAILANIVAR